MSMSLLLPIDETLTKASTQSRGLALIGPPKTCKTSLVFGMAFKLLQEDEDQDIGQKTTIVYVSPTKINLLPLHVHHMPTVTKHNSQTHRLRMITVESIGELLDLSVDYHDLERTVVPRAFILDDLHLIAERNYNKTGHRVDSKKLLVKIISNFMDLAAYYTNKFHVSCYVVITANDDLLADKYSCVQVASLFLPTLIHVERLDPLSEEEKDNLDKKTGQVKPNQVIKYKMTDEHHELCAYFKIDNQEIFYERLAKIV